MAVVLRRIDGSVGSARCSGSLPASFRNFGDAGLHISTGIADIVAIDLAGASMHVSSNVALNSAGPGSGACGFRTHHTLNTLHLVMERLWPGGRLMFGKEAIIVARLNARGRSAFTTAGVQALTRRDNRQVRRHHLGFAQLMFFHAMAPAFVASAAKVFSRDAGNRSANVRVG
jgi:hypothetical protein